MPKGREPFGSLSLRTPELWELLTDHACECVPNALIGFLSVCHVQQAPRRPRCHCSLRSSVVPGRRTSRAPAFRRTQQLRLERNDAAKSEYPRGDGQPYTAAPARVAPRPGLKLRHVRPSLETLFRPCAEPVWCGRETWGFHAVVQGARVLPSAAVPCRVIVLQRWLCLDNGPKVWHSR